ncbi:hypothetical protein [Desulfosporosinus fructosivorans]
MDCIENSSASLKASKNKAQLKEKLNKMGLMTSEQYEELDKKDKTRLLEVYNVISSMQASRAECLKAYKEQAISTSAVAEQICFQEELFTILSLPLNS